MNTKLQITQQDERGIGYNCKGCIKGKQPRPIFLRHLNCQRLWTTFCQQEGWLSVFISNVPLTGLVWHHHQHHHYHHQHHHYHHQHHHYHHHHIIIIINRPKPAYSLWRSQTSWRRRPMSSTSSSRRMESSLEFESSTCGISSRSNGKKSHPDWWSPVDLSLLSKFLKLLNMKEIY